MWVLHGSSASGSASGSNWLDLRVVCLNGEGCILTLNPSTMGWEVRKMVAEIIPRRGVQPGLHHLAAPLMLDRTLQEQGIVGTDTILLSCTYIPAVFGAAWNSVHGFPILEDGFAEGVTGIEASTYDIYSIFRGVLKV